jgi:hypothetical protein
MKTEYITLAFAVLMILVLGSPSEAERVTREEVQTAAENWIHHIIRDRGDWGESDEAEIRDIEELVRGEQLLGYVCHIRPVGFIVIPLHKEVGLVKAYSTYADMDPSSEEGGPALIKDGIERVLRGLEDRLGPIDSIDPADVRNLIEVDPYHAWERLLGGYFPPPRDVGGEGQSREYQPGDVLLSSHWHQKEPYNAQCPDMGCTWICQSNTNAYVGCVATSGAQILRYWNWPPYGRDYPYDDPYNWPAMPDTFSGCNWTPEQRDAVGELCSEVGSAVDMDYGCSGSAAYPTDMAAVFVHNYRYRNEVNIANRSFYETEQEWLDEIAYQINRNRPVQYTIPNHTIVVDGWDDSFGTLFYHVNYGWGRTGDCDGCDMWYQVDHIYGGDPWNEFMLRDIFPENSMGTYITGTYPLYPLFPYRYFDRDTSGEDATFTSGQLLQMLNGITVTCIGGTISFPGSSSELGTRLFTGGDISRGIRIKGEGTLELRTNGQLKLH